MAAFTTGDEAGWTGDAQFLVGDADGSYAQAAVTLTQLNYSYILSNIPYRYASVLGVDMTATGQTTLYTVPNGPALSGKKFYITNVLVKVASANTVTVAPTISVGKTAAWTEYIGATAMTGLDAVGEYKMLGDQLYGAPVSQRFDLGDIIKVDVSVGATATALTYDFYLFGIFL